MLIVLIVRSQMSHACMFVSVWHSLTCHVARMTDERLSKTVFYGEIQQGSGHKKRYKDTPKASLKDFIIPTKYYEQATQY